MVFSGLLGAVPRATVRHDYEFHKGPQKWLYLERNRAWMVLSNYSAFALLLLAPLLFLTEVGIAVQAWHDGWLGQKVAAWRATLGGVREIVRWRRRVQRQRRVELHVAAEHVSDDRSGSRFVPRQGAGRGSPARLRGERRGVVRLAYRLWDQ